MISINRTLSGNELEIKRIIMVEQNRNQYKPSVVTHPGETLKDALGALGMTQSEFADRTGLARKTVSEIITGRNRITPDTALLLERTLQVPAHFWLNRERNYVNQG